MDCNVAKQLMTDYLMGMTDESVKKEFEEHLAGCEECRSAFEELKKAEQEYDKKEGTEPLKKVNKVIKKHKRGKILAILGAVVLAAALIILIVGEVNPKSGFPSITRLKYKHKAEKILDALFTNDMESLMTGTFSDIVPGTNAFTYSKSKCVEDMIVDYSEQLKNLNKDFLYGQGYEIIRSWVKYEEGFQTYQGRIHPYQEEYKNYVFSVYMQVRSVGVFNIDIDFIDENHYDLTLSPDPDERLEFKDKMTDITASITQVELLAKGVDWKPYVLNERFADENGYVDIYGNVISSDCRERLEDENYIAALNGRFADIYNTSKTESLYIELLDYNFERHAANVELIWTIQDLKGNKAVMKKKMLYGPYSYEKLDDESEFIAEDGFDMELKEKMRNLF
ncbi:MAG: zf-HC2 domain-containing protein [Lachnospiraceae bacterium]|nr:zf-HC2 domain-containing protein [Lachnospiraceae bacterium]